MCFLSIDQLKNDFPAESPKASFFAIKASGMTQERPAGFQQIAFPKMVFNRGF